VSLFYLDLHSFSYISRSRIAGSYGSSIFIFLRSLHTVFHNGCTNLHSHQQCIRVSFSPHPHQRLLLFVFLIIAILTEVRWTLHVVLICISFIAKDVEHFFMCFLAIWTSSLKKFCSVHFSFSSLGHWLLESLVFWAPHIFWLFISFQMYSRQTFSPILWAASSIWWPFLLLCRSFVASCSPIYQSFLLVAEPFVFCLGTQCLCLLVPVCSLLFPTLASKVQVLGDSFLHLFCKDIIHQSCPSWIPR
jgi:hypothetical protein